MKRFLINSLLFVLLMIVLAIGVDFAISKGLTQMKDYRFQSWHEIANDKIDAEILILGNSRALSHFNSSIIEATTGKKTYNIGFGGHPLRLQLLKYNFYLQYNKPPQTIILNVDYASFVDADIIGHEREQVFPLIFDPYLKRELKFYGYTFNERYLPLYRYFGYQQVIKNGLLQFLKIKKYKNKTLEKGYLPEYGKWNGEELSRISNLVYKSDKATLNLLDSFLSECKTKSIDVILVHSPIYKGANDKLSNKFEMHNSFHKLANKYTTTYLDYSNHSLCNDTINFVVSVHLNDKAAKQFSEIIAKDITPYLQYSN